jgi:hypothetical protein
MTQKITIVDRLDWDCQCESCLANNGSWWTWRAEYFTNTDGTQEIEIICREDTDDHHHIQIPAGYAICKIEEATE